VGHPGWVLIPPEEKLTLVSVISAAGGPTRIADSDVVITRKLPDGSFTKVKANIKTAMNDASKDVALEDGDSIYVPEAMIGF